MIPISANVIESAFSPLISLFESVLVFVHQHIVSGSWGLAIVGLTVVVRAIMVPLTLKQFRSMRKMQILAPQLKEIQAKFKDDKQRQSEETMKFYKENGVNPFASCLPLVLQLPVFISLFYMLRTDLKLDICGPQMRKYFHVATNSKIPSSKLEKIGCSQVPGGQHLAKFLFIPDITVKASGVILIVLLALYVGSQLASSLLMATTVDRNQRLMMLGLPLIFVFFFIRYPAGLLVYWITTNFWTIGQQYLVRRRMGPPPPPPSKSVEVGAKPQAGRRAREPVLAGVGATTTGPPPRSPRKKKKRSGRRR